MIAQPLRWAVVIVTLDPTVGHEQQGTRRGLIVSREAFHRSGLAQICSISAARDDVRYPSEVAIPRGEAGQTKNGVILCHQVRTVSLERIDPFLVGTTVEYVTDPEIRRQVREALQHQLGLDLPLAVDAAPARSL